MQPYRITSSFQYPLRSFRKKSHALEHVVQRYNRAQPALSPIWQHRRRYSFPTPSNEKHSLADHPYHNQSHPVIGIYGQTVQSTTRRVSVTKISVISVHGKDKLPYMPFLPPPESNKLRKLSKTNSLSRRRSKDGRDATSVTHSPYMRQLDGFVFSKAEDEHKSPNNRELNMGRTIDTIRKRLPCLLYSPLPTDILSPYVSLYLFPSTHPNLPVVRGRVAYLAALWSTPVAWGRLPGLKVHLETLSEHFTKSSGPSGGGEKYIVKWRACTVSPAPTTNTAPSLFTTSTIFTSMMTSAKTDTDTIGASSSHHLENSSKINKQLNETYEYDTQFCGLFIFEFDSEGLIIKHSIENVEENSNHDKQSRVVAVTEWLLKKAKGVPEGKTEPSLAYSKLRDDRPGRFL